MSLKENDIFYEHQRETNEKVCDCCGFPTKWVENKVIYGKNYGKSYMVWLCDECGAYVGCHNNTKKPLGTMANAELREWRKKSKNLWIQKKLGGDWKNKELKLKGYKWLNNIFSKEFHFGSSTIEECELIYTKLTLS